MTSENFDFQGTVLLTNVTSQDVSVINHHYDLGVLL